MKDYQRKMFDSSSARELTGAAYDQINCTSRIAGCMQSFVCLSGSDNCIAVSELSATSGDIAGLTRMLSGRGGPSFTAHINRGK